MIRLDVAYKYYDPSPYANFEHFYVLLKNKHHEASPLFSTTFPTKSCFVDHLFPPDFLNLALSGTSVFFPFFYYYPIPSAICQIFTSFEESFGMPTDPTIQSKLRPILPLRL